MTTDKPRVLIVDDDAAIRRLLAVVCARLGLVCESASNGLEALEKLGTQPFDVLLLDLMMPKLNGFEVIERLRTSPRRPKIVVVTAQGEKQTAELRKEPVVEAVITKPFEMDALCEVLLEVTSDSAKPES